VLPVAARRWVSDDNTNTIHYQKVKLIDSHNHGEYNNCTFIMRQSQTDNVLFLGYSFIGLASF
jgi:hypothetical protein